MNVNFYDTGLLLGARSKYWAERDKWIGLVKKVKSNYRSWMGPVTQISIPKITHNLNKYVIANYNAWKKQYNEYIKVFDRILHDYGFNPFVMSLDEKLFYIDKVDKDLKRRQQITDSAQVTYQPPVKAPAVNPQAPDVSTYATSKYIEQIEPSKKPMQIQEYIAPVGLGIAIFRLFFAR